MISKFSNLFFPTNAKRKLTFVLFDTIAFSIARLRLNLIASDTNSSEKGIGKILITHFEEKIKNDGISIYGLSVRINNKRANEFYKRNNFEVERSGKYSITFIKRL